jgi:hypothetical protein
MDGAVSWLRRWGYRHDAPSKFFGRSQMEQYFEELKLDEDGLCEQCRQSSNL